MSLLSKKTAELAKGLMVEVDPKKDYVVFKAEGKRFQVKKTELYTFTFLIADEAVQAELMPVRKTEMEEFRREHIVRLKNDMRAGEVLTITCKVSVPERVVEGIKAQMLAPRKVFKLFKRVSTPAA